MCQRKGHRDWAITGSAIKGALATTTVLVCLSVFSCVEPTETGEGEPDVAVEAVQKACRDTQDSESETGSDSETGPGDAGVCTDAVWWGISPFAMKMISTIWLGTRK